ncbi:WD repeat-containing protein 54 isoform X7 [Scyliorhinus canicula]|uniref:WD repeat-containing protein 54 isoform X7 n=1 Tax=Scyliorhinus canicula TaxID=7830 RepID=UPI0018F36809|nr:WD repeat-containing protein 54 isoform X7 [Scyliorhinus canicula]
MYKREKSIQIKSSASAFYNNLSTLPITDKNLTYFAVIHGSLVNMVSASTDGLNLSHRQLQSKEGGMVHGTSLIMQMYESDGSIMVYWHALDTPEASTGSSTGSILVFNIPPKGTNITLSEILEQHRDPITDIACDCSEDKECVADLVSADDSGVLCIWKSGDDFKLMYKIAAYGGTCSSVKMWSGIIAAGYGSGQILIYDAAAGTVNVVVNAHARWICTLDVASISGKLLSGGEDSFLRIWRIYRNPETNSIEVEHEHTECVTDVQICGAKFCDPEGTAFAVTGYDLSEIIRYVQV